MNLMMKTESWDYDHFSVLLSTTFDESPHISASTSPTVHVLGGKSAGGSEGCVMGMIRAMLILRYISKISS